MGGAQERLDFESHTQVDHGQLMGQGSKQGFTEPSAKMWSGSKILEKSHSKIAVFVNRT